MGPRIRPRGSVVAAALAMAALPGGVALAASPTRGATYAGGDVGCIGRCPTVTLKVAARGPLRLTFDVQHWTATCASKDPEFGGNNVFEGSTGSTKPVPIRRGGVFGVKGSYVDRVPRSYGGAPAAKARVTFAINGRFLSGRRATGHYTASVQLFDSTGARTDTCGDTSLWTARRR
jgi:hypothetical protein